MEEKEMLEKNLKNLKKIIVKNNGTQVALSKICI
jgi:hypothetical protein